MVRKSLQFHIWSIQRLPDRPVPVSVFLYAGLTFRSRQLRYQLEPPFAGSARTVAGGASYHVPGAHFTLSLVPSSLVLWLAGRVRVVCGRLALASKRSEHPRRAAASTHFETVRTGGKSPLKRIVETTLIHWTDLEPVTRFAAVLEAQLTRARVMRRQAAQMIERMRCCAQPDEQFRRQRLVPSDMGKDSHREMFIHTLKEIKEQMFGNVPQLMEYVNEVIGMEEEVEKAHDMFLRQVMLYCTASLRKFIDKDYPAIVREYELLEKQRDAYDDTRSRYRAPGGPAVSIGGGRAALHPKVVVAKDELIEQANVLESLLDQLCETQMTFAKAVALFVAGEMTYRDRAHQLTNKIVPPDHPRRWKRVKGDEGTKKTTTMKKGQK